MEPRVIKTEQEYKQALAYVETLMDAAPDSSEERELELFALLIDTYEQTHYPIALPDPIDAIKFRMEQQDLRQKDMVPYLGSQSKVSEVLNRKRPLSLTMIRALHEGLGIPTDVLLQETDREKADTLYNPEDYPFKEMVNRGYFSPSAETLSEAKHRAAFYLKHFFSIFGDKHPQLFFHGQATHTADTHALTAWLARVQWLARKEDLPDFNPHSIDEAALRLLVMQSYFSTGPQNAAELLNRWGVHLIILRHLPKTYLDGASFLAPWGCPVIGLTLRYDSLDNFWYTLLHELAHVRLHLKQTGIAFMDETHPIETEHRDPREEAAHTFAHRVLIPADVWEERKTELLPSPSERIVKALSEELRISPAIVAGRIRGETQNYRRLGSLVGAYQVREQFEEYKTTESGGDRGQ